MNTQIFPFIFGELLRKRESLASLHLVFSAPPLGTVYLTTDSANNVFKVGNTVALFNLRKSGTVWIADGFGVPDDNLYQTFTVLTHELPEKLKALSSKPEYVCFELERQIPQWDKARKVLYKDAPVKSLIEILNTPFVPDSIKARSILMLFSFDLAPIANTFGYRLHSNYQFGDSMLANNDWLGRPTWVPGAIESFLESGSVGQFSDNLKQFSVDFLAVMLSSINSLTIEEYSPRRDVYSKIVVLLLNYLTDAQQASLLGLISPFDLSGDNLGWLLGYSNTLHRVMLNRKVQWSTRQRFNDKARNEAHGNSHFMRLFGAAYLEMLGGSILSKSFLRKQIRFVLEHGQLPYTILGEFTAALKLFNYFDSADWYLRKLVVDILHTLPIKNHDQVDKGHKYVFRDAEALLQLLNAQFSDHPFTFVLGSWLDGHNKAIEVERLPQLKEQRRKDNILRLLAE